MGYEKGTQEQLDAAREDARLLPYNTVFLSKRRTYSGESLPDGEVLVRGDSGSDYCDDEGSVAFEALDGSDHWYVDSSELEPIND